MPNKNSFLKIARLSIFLCGLSNFISVKIQSQENLIVNPDFEIQSISVYSGTQWALDNSIPFPITGAGWQSIFFTVEYYQNADVFVTPPNSDLQPMGYTYPCFNFPNICIEARNGQFFTGMYLYAYLDGNTEMRDVIRGTFSTPLESGKAYQLKFYTNNYSASCFVEEISLSLSNNLDIEINQSVTPILNPNSQQHQNLKDFLVTNTVAKINVPNTAGENKWVPVSANFVATGGEKYFYLHAWDIPLGEFLNPNSSLVILSPEVDTTNILNLLPVHYAYFDNFTLKEKPFFPTIVTLDNDTLNNNFRYSSIDVPCNISIFNRWGQQIGKITPENPYYYSESVGTYFYTGTCDIWEEKGYFEVVKN